MTGNELYEEYCNEYPLIMGYREVSYESWLQRQVLELRDNVVNKNYEMKELLEKLRDVHFKWNIGKYDSEKRDELMAELINNYAVVGQSELLKCPSCGSNDVRLSFADLKDEILKYKAKSEYQQASIVILRNIFKAHEA
jgi:hypothetical protein